MEVDMDWRQYIVVDPKILHGEPHFKGTSISVKVVLENIAAGNIAEDILKSYPHLNKNTINAALFYAAQLARDIDNNN